MRELTIGSLFAGIGGLELGLERAIPGARTIWQVEQDPFARRVLAKHWPQANRSVIDVREAGAHNLAPVGIVCAGWPCQGFAICGKQRGLQDTRSELWTEVRRLVGEIRPEYIVLENSPMLLGNRHDFGRVLSSLAALGFDAWWDCIPAAAIGADHRRDRFFCIAYSNDRELEMRRFYSGMGRIKGKIHDLSSSKRGPRWPHLADICGGDHEIPHRMDRNNRLANSVCPPVAEIVGEILINIDQARAA